MSGTSVEIIKDENETRKDNTMNATDFLVKDKTNLLQPIDDTLSDGIEAQDIEDTKYKDTSGNPTNIEVAVGQHLSKLVDKNYTPNINKILHAFKCNLKDLQHFKILRKT